jgi:hypothetical protein
MPYKDSRKPQPVELCFRMLLTEGGTQLHSHHEGFDRLGKTFT